MSLEEPDMLATAPAAAPLTAPKPGHSADVLIELFVNGQRFPVVQMGRGMLIFDQPVLLPGTEGELVLTIDGHPRRWMVSIPISAIPSKTVHAKLRDP